MVVKVPFKKKKDWSYPQQNVHIRVLAMTKAKHYTEVMNEVNSPYSFYVYKIFQNNI